MHVVYWRCEQDPLKDVGQVAQVEHVMELDSRGQESGSHFGVELQGAVDECGADLAHLWRKARHGQMLRQDTVVDRCQRI